MAQIISIRRNSQSIDVDKDFANYKYAISEHEPIQLSNGEWLHTYCCTRYNDHDPHGDIDVEQDAFNNELYN